MFISCAADKPFLKKISVYTSFIRLVVTGLKVLGTKLERRPAWPSHLILKIVVMLDQLISIISNLNLSSQWLVPVNNRYF